MALACDPNWTFFRGIHKYEQIHIRLYVFICKGGKGLRKGSSKKNGEKNMYRQFCILEIKF